MSGKRHAASAQITSQVNPPRSTLRPLQQGELDSFCGLYAVINALRHATRDQPRSQQVWREAFGTLVLFTELHLGAADVAITGMSTKGIWRLLKAAVPTLSEDLGVDVKFSRPLRDLARCKAEHALDHLSELTRAPGRSVLLALWGSYNHWSVLVRVTEKRLRLFDSCGLQYVHRDSCRMSYERRSRSQHEIWRSGVILIEAERQPSDSR